MPNALSKVVAFIILVFLLFVYPIKNELERQDEISRIYVLNKTIGFVDAVRNMGYISPEMYDNYLDELALTGNLYKVEMEHAKLEYLPVMEYDPVSGQYETVPGEFHKSYIYTYTSEIEEVLFPDPRSPGYSGTGNYYEMHMGDYFTVSVMNLNKTMATRIQEMVYGRTISPEKIFVTYGGMIRDESD
jgi:hypothetical protein